MEPGMLRRKKFAVFVKQAQQMFLAKEESIPNILMKSQNAEDP
jgi:hypothetical protein